MKPKPLPCAPALALILLGAFPAPAETFLVAVTETEGVGPSRPPLAAREGILAALFEDGHIAFDVPAGEPQPEAADLQRLATQAGAGTAAAIVVRWSQEILPGGTLRVRGLVSIVLADARAGRRTTEVSFTVDSEDREADGGRARLGREIGSALIRAFLAWSAGP